MLLIVVLAYFFVAEIFFVWSCHMDRSNYGTPLPWRFPLINLGCAIFWPISIYVGYVLNKAWDDTK
jgi:hypothetical protein